MTTHKGEKHRLRIVQNTKNSITVADGLSPVDGLNPESSISVQVRLQQPFVDPKLCIGCGICEHECPVSGKRAIRVTAENESRSPTRSMLLRRRT
jgi:ferredoxin